MDDVYTGRSLYEWKMSYLNNGQSLPSSSISGESKSTSIGGMDGLLQRKQVSSIKNEGLGLGDKPDYYTLKVRMIAFLMMLLLELINIFVTSKLISYLGYYLLHSSRA